MALIQPRTPHGTSASRLAEQRVHEWALHLDAERRRHKEESTRVSPGHIHPYIAISREAGAGGSAVAQRVGELIHWEVLNREILDEMADKFKLPRVMVSVADQSASNWLIEVFGKWLDPRLVTRSEYIVHLGQLVLLAAQHSSKVFVGRGAQYFLPVERGVSVFLVAPLAMRIQRIREVHSCSESEARRYVRDTDQIRRDLIKCHFNREVGDPHVYDLVINRARISVDAAAELIVKECRQRFSSV
jgi:cytidylate kinase